MAYLPLSTANLPDPAIDPAQGSSPADYFNTVLYTGDGTTPQPVTGMGFQADLLWQKRRDSSADHVLCDVIRGAGLRLEPNQPDDEYGFNANVLGSFDSDGFTTGSSAQTGALNGTYVAWGWKANGSGSTIAAGSIDGTNPTIASTVSANTESGFSIVSYSGAIDGSTVKHGLNQAPELVIFKNRDISSGWFVMGYPTNPNFTADGSYLLLDGTSAMQDSGGNEIEIGSSVITLVDAGSSIGGANSLTDRIIAYCFHSVEGFSKCSSYRGNGSADGPFVYTGFRPAFIMSKRTDSSGDWHMYDVARDEYNVAYKAIWANYSSAEYLNYNNVWDILSNGFKARTSSVITNASGGTYIYMAFAENPFKYSNAR